MKNIFKVLAVIFNILFPVSLFLSLHKSILGMDNRIDGLEAIFSRKIDGIDNAVYEHMKDEHNARFKEDI